MKHPLVGKRILCHLETADRTSDKNVFTADVGPGRHEGEVHLKPISPGSAGPAPTADYYEARSIYVREFLDKAPANLSSPQPPQPPEVPPSAAELVVLPPAPTEAAIVPVPTTDVPEPEPEPVPPPEPAPEAELDLNARRLSESPVASETRRRRGRGAPADHGAAAARPDEFQEGAATE